MIGKAPWNRKKPGTGAALWAIWVFKIRTWLLRAARRGVLKVMWLVVRLVFSMLRWEVPVDAHQSVRLFTTLTWFEKKVCIWVTRKRERRGCLRHGGWNRYLGGIRGNSVAVIVTQPEIRRSRGTSSQDPVSYRWAEQHLSCLTVDDRKFRRSRGVGIGVRRCERHWVSETDWFSSRGLISGKVQTRATCSSPLRGVHRVR